ncbi:hypothetical protein [Desulfoferrobacter suflitae]|uniref:hypothetical protein n=1 Tax=Desulfoferrobacter suflitae TaxID=2865782 RepID=UPI0021647469|nr:hypothetical protein [Desulfoferrobacter suflitae]MCK8603920.1 hypothetical protein [Desulfoferrobacter suflitae]
MVRVTIEPQAATNVKVLIQAAVDNQLRIIEFGIAGTKAKLQELENRLGMASEDFYRQFSEGKLGDDMEYIRWAGEYETLEKLQRDYDDLRNTQLC